MRAPLLAAWALTLLLPPTPSAQPTFGGGAAGGPPPWTKTTGIPVTYVDGYRTEGTLYLPPHPAGSMPPDWPVVVYVHGLAGTHEDPVIDDEAGELAEAGYAVWAYSVRGQGVASDPCLNPWETSRGMTIWGGVEAYDLAEQIEVARAFPHTDPDAVAVMGTSQGAIHAFKAAAFSGQFVHGPPGHHVTDDPILFPVIDAVAAHAMSTDGRDLVLRDGDWMSGVAGNLGLNTYGQWTLASFPQCGDGATLPHVVFDQLPIDMTDGCGAQSIPLSFPLAMMAAGIYDTPQTLAPIWDAPETCESRPIQAALAASSVPIFYAHAYRDIVMNPWAGVRVLHDLTMPRRIHLTTGGHNSPVNTYETKYRRQLRRRWFDHHVKGIDNGVDADETYSFAAQPTDETVIGNPATLWGHRVLDDWEPAPLSSTRLYLDGTSLEDALPAQPAPSVTLTHPGFCWNQWKGLVGPEDNGVERSHELLLDLMGSPDRLTLVSAPFTEEVELAGTIELSLSVEAQATPVDPTLPPECLAVLADAFHIAGTVWARPPGTSGSEDVYLTSWGQRACIDCDTEPVQMTLGAVSTVLPYDAGLREGTRLVLEVSPLWGWTRSEAATALEPIPNSPPFAGVELQTVPAQSAFTVDVAFGADSWLELPTLDEVHVSVATKRVAFPDTGAGSIALEIEGGQLRAGDGFRVLVGEDGHGPGTYNGAAVPMTVTQLTLDVDAGVTNGTTLAQFSGTLDAASGTATVTFAPSDVFALATANLEGERLTFVVLTDPGGAAPDVSNPLDVWIK